VSLHPLPVYVEFAADVRFAVGLLSQWEPEIKEGWAASGAITSARLSLSTHPERPVAVLLRARTRNAQEVEELRGSANRLLSGFPRDNWCVSIAVPDLDAWATMDPRIKREWDSLQNGRASYTDRSARFADLTASQPFDSTELLRAIPDYRELVEFIQRHTRTPTTGAVRSA